MEKWKLLTRFLVIPNHTKEFQLQFQDFQFSTSNFTDPQLSAVFSPPIWKSCVKMGNKKSFQTSGVNISNIWKANTRKTKSSLRPYQPGTTGHSHGCWHASRFPLHHLAEKLLRNLRNQFLTCIYRNVWKKNTCSNKHMLIIHLHTHLLVCIMHILYMSYRLLSHEYVFPN